MSEKVFRLWARAWVACFLVLLFVFGLHAAPAGPTLLVTNEGVNTVQIGDHMGSLGRIMAGETRCLVLRPLLGQQRLWWKNFAEKRHYTIPVYLSHSPGWEWTLSEAYIVTEISLIPLRTPCRP
jgi:hypothetical protein